MNGFRIYLAANHLRESTNTAADNLTKTLNNKGVEKILRKRISG
jgi:hypothetical protein